MKIYFIFIEFNKKTCFQYNIMFDLGHFISNPIANKC